MNEFWLGILAVFIGAILTTVSHVVISWAQTAPARKRDEKRKAMLRELLRNPGPTGWRKMTTLSNVVGLDRDETARLLIEIDARASESGEDVWAFIADKPLPKAEATE